MEDIELTVPITKVDETQRLAFGWASVIEEADGTPVVDLQNHLIEVEELEQAVYRYMIEARGVTHMHKDRAGEVVESVMLTREKRRAMGLDESGPVGWWVGLRLSPATFARVQRGELGAFSIGGRGVLEDL
jgi:hypothetical protein